MEVFDWGRIEELLDEYTDIRDWYEGGLSAIAVGRIESKIDKLCGVVEQSPGPNHSDDSHDGFHAALGRPVFERIA